MRPSTTKNATEVLRDCSAALSAMRDSAGVPQRVMIDKAVMKLVEARALFAKGKPR